MRLITFPHSHFCEKARWALDLAGLEYVEEPHLPLLHRWHTGRLGGGSVPLLVTADAVHRDSAAITAFAAPRWARRENAPTPAEEAEVRDWMQSFDEGLGRDTRRVAYFHLLDRSGLITRIASRGVPAGERRVAPLVTMITRPLIRRAFRIDAQGAACSLSRIDSTFAAVSERLADGRAYLVGGALSPADVSFAALAAPVLLPERFGGTVPALEEVPPALRETCERLRATPAGTFAMRLYERHRGRPAAATRTP